MMGIKDLSSMVYKVFDKKTASGTAIKKNILKINVSLEIICLSLLIVNSFSCCHYYGNDRFKNSLLLIVNIFVVRYTI